MNTPNFNLSFFNLDSEISNSDSVTIAVDHEVLMSIHNREHWDSLHPYESDFVSWYQSQINEVGMMPSPVFIVDSSLINVKPYSQDKVCRQLLIFLGVLIEK